MPKLIGRVVSYLMSLRLDVSALKEDLRKIGIIFFGSGCLAIILKNDSHGLIAVFVGLIIMYIGLIKSTDSEEE